MPSRLFRPARGLFDDLDQIADGGGRQSVLLDLETELFLAFEDQFEQHQGVDAELLQVGFGRDLIRLQIGAFRQKGTDSQKVSKNI